MGEEIVGGRAICREHSRIAADGGVARPSLCGRRRRLALFWEGGGPSRNRTGVQGFAVLCVTTPPSGRGEGRALARASAAGQPPADANGRFDEWRLAWAAPPDKSHLDLQVYYWHRTVMTVQRPIPEFAAAREAMVESQLRPQGVTDRAVLEAMRRTPREDYVPSSSRPLAYVDRAIPIGPGRYLAPPAVLGQLLTQMMPLAGQRALVVGAGTG